MKRSGMRWLIISLSLCVSLLSLVIPVFASAGVLTAVYKDFSDYSQLTINGSARGGVSAGDGHKVLRLTPAIGDQGGSAFLTKRVSLVGGRSFSSYFSFQMSQQGGNWGINGADGLVFVIQTKANNVGGSGGGIGYQGISPSVGVEFDTFYNDESYAQDPSGNHIGINLNGSAHSVATFNPTASLKQGIWSVWVDYNGGTKKLEVRAVENSTTRPANPTLTYPVDLQSVLNMDEVYVGFTASTGGGWENHDIRSLLFNNDYTPIDPGGEYTEAATDVSLLASPASLSVGQSSTVTAIVKNSKQQPMSGQMVTFTTTLGTITQTAMTDANGVATAALTSSATGTAKVKAQAVGGAYGEVSVQFTNTPPVADSLSVQGLEDQPLQGTLSGSDADGDSLIYSLVNQPQKGTVSISPSGQFTYVPAANENGNDSFAFKVNDGKADSNIGVVSVTIAPVNDAPSFVKGNDMTANKVMAGQAISISAWASNISAGPANESGQKLAFSVSNNHNDLFAVQPALSPDGTLSFTPTDNVTGTATVSVSLTDDGGTANGGISESAVQFFTIKVDSINPTITVDVPTAWTNGSDVVTVEFDGTGSAVTVTKWAAGAQTAEYFATSGSALTSNSFTVTSNGSYTLFAQDEAGNQAVKVVSVGNIDKVAPVTAASIAPAGPYGWYTSDAVLTLSAHDDLSGVAKTEYRVNNGAWTTYTGSIPAFHNGVYQVVYRSIDNAGNVETEQSKTIQVDTTSPTLNVSLDKTTLWPPNHQMVDITATLDFSDAASGIASVVLTSITSNEPDNGLGDGDTANDIQGAEYGTQDNQFSLRAERSGQGAGRVYTITYTVTDKAGNQVVKSLTVNVSHDNSSEAPKKPSNK
jgi:VCBS repeat-containing protein